MLSDSVFAMTSTVPANAARLGKLIQFLATAIAIWLIHPEFSAAANLTDLPLLGAISDTAVNVWIRADVPASAVVQYQTAGKNWSEPLAAGPVALTVGSDFTGTVALTNLQAGTSYEFRVILDGGTPGTPVGFKTLPAQGTAAKFTFVFGSGLQQDRRPHTIFNAIAGQKPDFALPGDTFYSDLVSGPAAEADFWSGYKANRDSPRSRVLPAARLFLPSGTTMITARQDPTVRMAYRL